MCKFFYQFLSLVSRNTKLEFGTWGSDCFILWYDYVYFYKNIFIKVDVWGLMPTIAGSSHCSTTSLEGFLVFCVCFVSVFDIVIWFGF